jgi:hypothetical protein
MTSVVTKNFPKDSPIENSLSLISVLHIEVIARPYVMSKISYFIVRTFDVKHHAAHGTNLLQIMRIIKQIKTYLKDKAETQK